MTRCAAQVPASTYRDSGRCAKDAVTRAGGRSVCRHHAAEHERLGSRAAVIFSPRGSV